MMMMMIIIIITPPQPLFNGLTLLAYLNYTPRTPSQNWTPDSL